MGMEAMTRPVPLSDEELTAEVQRLARSERESTAALIARLAEFEARRLHLGAGFSSLFMYCTEIPAAVRARGVQPHRGRAVGPEVPARSRPGRGRSAEPHDSAPARTTSDGREPGAPAAEASYKSKREVEEVIARHVPRPDVPSSVRKVPTPRSVHAGSAAVGLSFEASSGTAMTAAGSFPGDGERSAVPAEALCAESRLARREIVRPLAPDRYEVRFTATAQTCEKLRLAKDLLRHAVPDGDIAEVVDRALTLLLDDLARKRLAATPRPRPSGAPACVAGRSESRHIPATVKRTVWLRDGGRCAFVGRAARRCAERGFLEFHHVRPYAVGGAATADNIEIRCRAHNAYEADLFHGEPGRAYPTSEHDGTSSSFQNELLRDSEMRQAPLS
jgi:hypothetical protein